MAERRFVYPAETKERVDALWEELRAAAGGPARDAVRQRLEKATKEHNRAKGLGFHRDPDDLTPEERRDVIRSYAWDPDGWNNPGLLIRLTDLRSRWLFARDRGEDDEADGLIETFIAWAVGRRKRWAWDGLVALFLELCDREDPLPDSLQRWANGVAYDSLKGRLKPPPRHKNPKWRDQDERDLRIFASFAWLTQGAIERGQALYEIGLALDMPPNTVENAVTKWAPTKRRL